MVCATTSLRNGANLTSSFTRQAVRSAGLRPDPGLTYGSLDSHSKAIGGAQE